MKQVKTRYGRQLFGCPRRQAKLQAVLVGAEHQQDSPRLVFQIQRHSGHGQQPNLFLLRFVFSTRSPKTYNIVFYTYSAFGRIFEKDGSINALLRKL